MAAPDRRRVPDDVEDMRSEVRTLSRRLPGAEWQARLVLLHRIWELSGRIAQEDERRPESAEVLEAALSA